MKAVRVPQWGHPLQLEDIPQPAPGRDEVLVRVHAASLNPLDRVVIAGYLQHMLTAPMTVGTDFAGEVVAAGAEVTHVQPGDAVYGMILLRDGAFAEYAIAKANEVARKPHSLDHAQAAAVPLTALTAWQSVLDLGRVQRGERVLIHGAGGNVGSFAVQFARNAGAFVIAHVNADKMAFVQTLGVDQGIDAGEQPFETVLDRVDVVLNYASPELESRSYALLQAGGRYVSTVGDPGQEEAEKRGITAVHSITYPTAERLAEIAALLDAGTLKVFVDCTFGLEAAQAAFDYMHTQTAPGKIVLMAV